MANAPATAAHFGGATGAANQASQAMLSSHLASQLAVAGVSTGALSVPGAAAGGYGLSPASSMNMFSQGSDFFLFHLSSVFFSIQTVFHPNFTFLSKHFFPHRI